MFMNMKALLLTLFVVSQRTFVVAGPIAQPEAISDKIPYFNESLILGSNSSFRLQARQDPVVSTCGFFEGDANIPRTAGPGFDCRVDTSVGLWGFCPTTVINARDCGLAGNCVDSHACTTGCGITGNPSVTTFHCTAPGANFCSSDLLTAGVDQTYTYIACAAAAITNHYLAVPTTTSFGVVTTTSQAPTPAAPSSTSAVIPPSTSNSKTSPTSPTSSSIQSVTSPPSSQTQSPSRSNSQTTSTPTSASTSNPDAANPSSASPSSSSTPNNTGAIIGGVLGGIVLIGIFVLAAIYLRRRQHRITREKENMSAPPYRTTEMQTAGLFEKEARLSRAALFEKEAGYSRWSFKPKRDPVELPG